MKRFDYLHDAPPPFIESLRTARLPRRLHAVCGVIIMLLCVMSLAYLVNAVRIAQALRIEHVTQARFDRSRVALAGVRLAWQELDALIAEDRRLHEIRLSSSIVADRLARTGNLLTPHIWLTSLSSEENGHLLKGSAENLAAVEKALDRMLDNPALGAPHLVRVFNHEERGASSLVGFELRVDGAR